MGSVIDAAFSRSRTVLMVLAVLLIAGAASYWSIPKESEPDIAVPLIYVSMTHEGISPEDAERLLIRPMETELRSIEGVKEVRAVGSSGYASVTLEFQPGFNAEKALRDVREKVDIAKTKLPADTDEPTVNEVNVALFPILSVILSGDMSERQLVTLARRLKDDIEGLPGVLEVEIGGDREELLEVEIDPLALETYNISIDELFQFVDRNNRLVAAGAIESSAGRFVVKVPGVIEDIRDVLKLPIKVSGSTVVRFEDVATIRRTFKDPQGFARVDGRPAVALEIKKRLGANIIETVEGVRGIVAEHEKTWPGTVSASFMQDKSKDIQEMLSDLQNNVVSAILLVMVVVIAALGLRSALLVGLAIPGSFLAGILILNAMGMTLNIVVLFSLILVVGMLVDGAIVVIELADRQRALGHSARDAYSHAAKRMFWPVVASTATTLSVFFPLLFWPDMVGEFMKFLPITVIATLGASLFMALVFVPVLGAAISGKTRPRLSDKPMPGEGDSNPLELRGFTGRYARLLDPMLARPGRTLLVAIAALVGAYTAYGAFGKGVEFFPSTEPKFAQVQVQARGDMSVFEKDDIVRRVSKEIVGMKEMRSVYARTMGVRPGGGSELAEDVIGVIQLEFVDWDKRRKAAVILDDILARTAGIPGIRVTTVQQKGGPTSGKPIQIEISGINPAALAPVAGEISTRLKRMPGLKDVADSRPLDGIEWRLNVDREKAAKFGVDITLLGTVVRLVTNGVKVAEYRPDDAQEEVDITVRLTKDYRTLDQLRRLRVPTQNGAVPISNFVTLDPSPKTGVVNRTDGRRVLKVEADVEDGVLAAEKIAQIKAALAGEKFPEGVNIKFAGQDEDQASASAFLGKAFLIAIFLMTLSLVTQFNSLSQAAIVLSAIVFSTAGVLLGLLIAGHPFGIVMGGIGIIALAGIVVNNNIVLIDTYNELRREGQAPREAALRTAVQRLRPVLLTSVTTVLGLLPMVLAVNLDFIGREISIGAPSTQWWTQLSSAIAGGLTFATLLTLVLTPCLLMLTARFERRREAAALASGERGHPASAPHPGAA